jgi:SAM-dependent methyltransferase
VSSQRVHVVSDERLRSPGDKCIACGSRNVTPFFEIGRVPVQCNVLWPTCESAISAPVGEIRLGFCSECSHIWNLAYDPSLMQYTQSYENSLHFSPRFREYLDELIAELDRTCSLRGKKVIDVGCGRGDFLKALCRQTGCAGVGFDRSYDPEDISLSDEDGSPEFVVDFYGEQYADYPVDLITCRHVLEHIEDPLDFVTMIRRTMGDRQEIGTFFEVPNALYTIKRLGIWDIIYEHVSYFTANSLAALFNQSGFRVRGVNTVYDGQFLTIHADPAPNCSAYRNPVQYEPMATLKSDVAAFQQRYQSKLETWREHLRNIEESGSKAVIWGTGSKGVTFLNALEVRDAIAYAVDINPRKHGMFVAGTGQEVVAPTFLREFRPDVVVVLNKIYETEIKSMLASLDVDAEILFA